MEAIVNDSLEIVLDNIKVLGSLNRLNTYRQISHFTSIPLSTLGSWYSTKRKKKIYPRLSTLDKLCDAFTIHTSELFKPKNDFQTSYNKPNNSMLCFRTNLNKICNEKTYASAKDRIDLLYSFDPSGRDHYYSYVSVAKGRSIPIYELDRYANILSILSYELLLPIKEEAKNEKNRSRNQK